MKLRKINFFAILLSIFLLSSNILAQTPETVQTNPVNQNDGDIVEAGESVIKIVVEKPQVQLFSQRIKPEFDEVNLEKTFIREILDEGQTVKIKKLNDEELNRIDIKKLLNRNR